MSQGQVWPSSFIFRHVDCRDSEQSLDMNIYIFCCMSVLTQWDATCRTWGSNLVTCVEGLGLILLYVVLVTRVYIYNVYIIYRSPGTETYLRKKNWDKSREKRNHKNTKSELWVTIILKNMIYICVFCSFRLRRDDICINTLTAQQSIDNLHHAFLSLTDTENKFHC